MAKRPQGLLLTPGTDNRDAEVATPTSQSHSEGWHSQANSESFTGWPWTVRHDYQQLRVGTSSGASQVSQPSRGQSWDNDEEPFLGKAGLAGLSAGSSPKLQHALFLVIGLNALAMMLESAFISFDGVQRVMKFFEMVFTAVFMVLVLRVIRMEVASFSNDFRAKQVVREGDRKEEMMVMVRNHVADLRDAVLSKQSHFEKDFVKRLAKGDQAIAFAKAEATAMRRQLEAAEAEAEAARVAADTANDRLAELESAVAALRENGHGAPQDEKGVEEQPTSILASLKEKVPQIFGGGGIMSAAAAPAAPLAAQEGESEEQNSAGDSTAISPRAVEPPEDVPTVEEASPGHRTGEVGADAPSTPTAAYSSYV
mmetsp:Transcript_84669/g.218228  ORF Transcript_84669/g.218228 Transcript_84669/m.218228 type:complete len:369 (+) Transcript_84669:70-1176(+)